MPTRRPTPSFQIRVIGPASWADRLLAHLAEQAMPLFGPLVTCTTQTRPACRRGHVRAYFTVTPKEDAGDSPRLLHIGRSTAYDLIRSGRLRSIKIGSRRLIPVSAIEEAISALMNGEC